MSTANAELAGTVLPRFKIKDNHLRTYSHEEQNDLYVCVQLNRRW